MFKSLPDEILVKFEKRVGKLPQKIKHIRLKNTTAKETWVCFVPELITRVGYLRKNFLGKSINADIYVSSETTVQPNPKKTRDYLEKILKEAIKREKQNKTGNKLNVLGISMGNVLAFRFAEYFKINKFVSVVPGSKLSECIFESIATKKIAFNSGRSLKTYQKELRIFDPEAHIDTLKAKKIKIYLGKYDKMIPYKRGFELVKKMKQKGLRPMVKIYPDDGHVEVIVKSIKEIFK
jgi:dienelactone hydrolase